MVDTNVYEQTSPLVPSAVVLITVLAMFIIYVEFDFLFPTLRRPSPRTSDLMSLFFAGDAAQRWPAGATGSGAVANIVFVHRGVTFRVGFGGGMGQASVS